MNAAVVGSLCLQEGRESFATVNGVDYCIKVRPPQPQYQYHWVDIQEYQPATSTCSAWWKSVFSESVHYCETELEAIRVAFRMQRDKMRRWINSWSEYRAWAWEEKGGKKGYYTRHANQARKYALEYSVKWKLCKTLWKEITRL